MSLTVQQITERLENIEAEVESRQDGGETAAEDNARARRKYELAYAKAYVVAKGGPMDKKQIAIDTVAQDQELVLEVIRAEAAYEGWKAAMRSRELRTSIGQSLLRSQREMGG